MQEIYFYTPFVDVLYGLIVESLAYYYLNTILFKMFKFLLLTVVLSVTSTMFAQESLEFNPRFDDKNIVLQKPFVSIGKWICI